MKKLFFDFRRNVIRFGAATLTALTVAMIGSIHGNMVSAETIEECIAAVTSDEILTYATSSFSATIAGKTTADLVTFGAEVSGQNTTGITISTFSGTGPLVIYISSSASTSPSTGQTKSVTGKGTYYLTLPANPYGKHLYGTNQSSATLTVAGTYSHS